MRVLLVHIVDPERGQDAVVPAGLGYIAAYLRQEMHDLEIRIAQHNLENAVRGFHPDVVGVSVVTQNYAQAERFCVWCKAHDDRITTIVGGHHVSALPGSISDHMALAGRGGGEVTMLEGCRAIQRSGLDEAALRSIKGSAYRDGQGELVLTDPRPLIQELDALPLPARDLMHIRHGDAVGIISSRGCPYNCVFCASKSFWGAPRFHSAEYVVREVEAVLEQFRPRHIYFWDDLFVANRQRFRRIVSMLREKGIPEEVQFSLNCRANLVDQELVQLMRAMNVFEVSIGLESFSPDTLAYLKDHVSVEDNWRAVRLLSQAGIRVLGFFIIGSPRETRDDVLQTLDAVQRADLYRAQTYLLAPLPGTPVWDYARRRGLVSEDMDWSKLYIDAPDDDRNGIVLSEVLEPEEVRKLLAEFQAVRKRKEAKVLREKVATYSRLLLVDPRSVFSLLFKALKLRLYRLRHRIMDLAGDR